MNQKIVYLVFAIIILGVIGVSVYALRGPAITEPVRETKTLEQITKLPKPVLGFMKGARDYVQIVIAYECDKKYNIYRSKNSNSGFKKIFQADYRRNPNNASCGGGSLVDYVLLDENGVEVQESEIGEVKL